MTNLLTSSSAAHDMQFQPQPSTSKASEKNLKGEDSSEEEMLSDDDESVFQPYYNRLVQPRDYSTAIFANRILVSHILSFLDPEDLFVTYNVNRFIRVETVYAADRKDLFYTRIQNPYHVPMLGFITNGISFREWKRVNTREFLDCIWKK